MNDRTTIRTALHSDGELYITFQSVIDIYSQGYEKDQNPTMKEFWKNQVNYWKNLHIISKGDHILDEVFKK